MFENIVILTGAGISRESGLDTFRDPDGIWARVNLEDVATPEAFARNPNVVHDFYNSRRRQLLSDAVRPNRAHLALAALERSSKTKVTLITQNIDDLHERAGSSSVLHMHGELLKARCGRCDAISRCTQDLSILDTCSVCGATGTLRPHVVWFGEIPLDLDRALKGVETADLFLSIGTSGTVYPAAGFVDAAKRAGVHTVELNLERSTNAGLFDEGFYGPATDVVGKYVAGLLSDTRT